MARVLWKRDATDEKESKEYEEGYLDLYVQQPQADPLGPRSSLWIIVPTFRAYSRDGGFLIATDAQYPLRIADVKSDGIRKDFHRMSGFLVRMECAPSGQHRGEK